MRKSILVKIWDEDNKQPITSIKGDKQSVLKDIKKVFKDKC